MTGNYIVTGSEKESEEGDVNLYLDDNDRFEKITQPAAVHDYPEASIKEPSLWQYFADRIRRVSEPLWHKKSRGDVLGMLAVSWFVSVLTWLANFDAILGRGWRLEVVKKLSLGDDKVVPDFSLSSILGYFANGIILLFARTFYFIPMILFALLSGYKFVKIAWKLAVFIYDKAVVGTDASWSEFFFYKVLPQATAELLVQFLFVTLYTMLVWPVYRILMIQYAVGEIKWTGFFSINQFKRSAGIFRRNASSVYAVYAFMLSLQIALYFILKPIDWVSFGFADRTFLPIVYVIFWYWPIGYAYGVLGRTLIQRGEIRPTGRITPDLNEEYNEEYV